MSPSQSEVRDAIETLESLVDGRPDEGIGEVLQPIVDLLRRSDSMLRTRFSETKLSRSCPGFGGSTKYANNEEFEAAISTEVMQALQEMRTNETCEPMIIEIGDQSIEFWPYKRDQ